MAPSELESKVVAVLLDPSSVEVFYPHLPYPTTLPHQGATRVKFSAISDRPLWSKDYSSCVGVALVGEHRSALTHHSKLTGDPYKYIPELVEALKVAGESNITAAVLGGNWEHFEAALAVLNEQRIPVVGVLNEDKGISANKLMVVLPSAREVITYGMLNGGYQLLMSGSCAVQGVVGGSLRA